MTTDDDSPRDREVSIGIDTDEWPPLQGESDEDVALALEEEKQLARQAVDDVNRALLNEGTPLTDEKVHNLWRAGHALSAISDALVRRVPPEHRIDPEAGPYDGYYEMGEE